MTGAPLIGVTTSELRPAAYARPLPEGDPPQAGVNTRKQNRLGKLANGYLKLKRIRQAPCRFDVVAVIFNDEGAVKAIRHIPNAFSVAPW